MRRGRSQKLALAELFLEQESSLLLLLFSFLFSPAGSGMRLFAALASLLHVWFASLWSATVFKNSISAAVY